MKIVNSGDIYRFYDDNLRIYDKLPVQTYSVTFHPMAGFALEENAPLEIKEKVYGAHMDKVQKILNRFQAVDRNFGVILSGDKGIGKSLCARMLAIEAMKQGYPVILVKQYYSGLADFIDKIEQEAVVLFDEFDKTYIINSGSVNDETAPQDELLSLLDGLNCGKKLFVITCNDVYKLSDYLVNRPGRFHYHLRFSYPNEDEIQEYLHDKVPQEFWAEINKVVEFSHRVKLNYDCLRAIAFELSMGETFANTIQDLNILHIEEFNYEMQLHYENGEILKASVSFDPFEACECEFSVRDRKSGYMEYIFNPAHMCYSLEQHCEVIDGKYVSRSPSMDGDDIHINEYAKKGKLLFITLKNLSQQETNLHYLV